MATRTGDGCDGCAYPANLQQEDMGKNGIRDACDGDIDDDGGVYGEDFGIFASCFKGSGNPPKR